MFLTQNVFTALKQYYTFVPSEESKVGPSRGTIGRDFLVASGRVDASTSLISPIIQNSYRGKKCLFYLFTLQNFIF